ncbi:DUF2254 family protein [Nocardia terpenica]|uniref:DUF2254 family protein n=1 Tax=Nocardia terpenica TaxID=455432 RepID=UPI001E4384C5|nr:DUF2254 family protein [Nocardia terpenica]
MQRNRFVPSVRKRLTPPSRRRRRSRSRRPGQQYVRTLVQDVSFGVDQIVEIALRALSPAVNDTFTALTCIDWLGDCLSRIAVSWNPTPVRRCRDGYIRVIAAQVSYERLVQRAFEKIRQAGAGQPAVMIRELDALAQIADRVTEPERRRVVYEQAAMIERQVAESVPEEADREDVLRRCLIFRTALALT